MKAIRQTVLWSALLALPILGCESDADGDAEGGADPSGSGGQGNAGDSSQGGSERAGASTGGIAGNGGSLVQAGNGGAPNQGGSDQAGATSAGMAGLVGSGGDAGGGGLGGFSGASGAAGGDAGGGGLGGNADGGMAGCNAGRAGGVFGGRGGRGPGPAGGRPGSPCIGFGGTAGFGGPGGASGAAGACSVAGSGPGGATGGEFDTHCIGCTREKLGTPSWEPTGAVVVLADTSNGWDDWINSVLPPRHAVDPNQTLIVPQQVHAGPYVDEAYQMITAAGLTPTQTFTSEEFTPPFGVGFFINVVPSPGASNGSSVDFDCGPIIPNHLFPMNCDGDAFRNDDLYDTYFDSILPGYSMQSPPIPKDGPSHMIWMLGEDSSYGPANTPAEGCYEIVYSVVDSLGLGWIMRIPFAVTDTEIPGCLPDANQGL